MPKAVWITGASGFIGRHLARCCDAHGMSVAGIGRGAWGDDEAAEWGVRAWRGGAVSAVALDALLDLSGAPDILFHLAGGSSVGKSIAGPVEDFLDTTLTTLQILDWMRERRLRCRLVLASSAAVYGEQGRGPAAIRESDPARPSSPYGAHKRAAEQLCEYYGSQYGLDVAAVRMFSVYGPWLRKQLLWDLCRRMADGPREVTLSGTGDEERDFLHVSDAAELLRRVGAGEVRPPGGPIINGGTGIGTRVRDVARQVVRAFGVDSEIRFSGEGRPGDPTHLIADVAAVSGAGWAPATTLADGIGGYVSWYREVAAPALT